MKKLLITTALLAATGSMAAAEVTISGSGRFGLVYNEDIDPLLDPSETQISGRLRFNIDASKETDAGVTFGGRIRLQYSINNTEPTLSPAYLYAEYSGFRFEVGNSNTAFDSAALYYDSEVGFISSSFGNRSFDFYSFSSSPYSAAEENRVGIFLSYSVGDFTGQISYVDPDQSGLTAVEEEISIALAYETDSWTVSGAAVQDGAGLAGNDQYFLGAAYNISEAFRAGILYTSTEDNAVDSFAVGDTITLFGSYTTGPVKIEAYIANNDDEANLSDTVYGIGADYDIGGATISGSIQRGYSEETYADLGVNFSF